MFCGGSTAISDVYYFCRNLKMLPPVLYLMFENCSSVRNHTTVNPHRQGSMFSSLPDLHRETHSGDQRHSLATNAEV